MAHLFDTPNLIHLLLKSAPAAILFVGKHSIRHHTCWDLLFLFLFLRSRLTIIEQSAIRAFFGSNLQSEPEELGDRAHDLLDVVSTGTVGSRHLDL